MKLSSIALLCFCICSCYQSHRKTPTDLPQTGSNHLPIKSYDEIKDSIAINRKRLSIKYPSLDSLSKKENVEEITDFWIKSIGTDLFSKWQNTPWDFNGTAIRPNEGAIACGYFVTTVLRDMDLKIDRIKLAICPSSIMMQSLAPHQRIKNLSYLSYADFNDTLKLFGKGVYIIGLDFHTGFIINDGTQNWFIHSNYIQRNGVVKEILLNSAALRSSKTRWMISLTNDRDFLFRWLMC